jgi:hypothetical protein
MGKLPAFMFYPRDWLIDPELSKCSLASRGVLMDCLCYMWESEIRGALVTKGKPWTREELALAVRGEYKQVLACINQLLGAGVLHITGTRPVTLRYGPANVQFGTLPPHTIYSRRLVRDELTRASSRKRQQTFRDKHNGKVTPDITPPSQRSSSSSSYKETEPTNVIFSQDTESGEVSNATPKKAWVNPDVERKQRTNEALSRFPDSESVARHSGRDVLKKQPK